jgi:hypothetical protein
MIYDTFLKSAWKILYISSQSVSCFNFVTDMLFKLHGGVRFVDINFRFQISLREEVGCCLLRRP